MEGVSAADFAAEAVSAVRDLGGSRHLHAIVTVDTDDYEATLYARPRKGAPGRNTFLRIRGPVRYARRAQSLVVWSLDRQRFAQHPEGNPNGPRLSRFLHASRIIRAAVEDRYYLDV